MLFMNKYVAPIFSRFYTNKIFSHVYCIIWIFCSNTKCNIYTYMPSYLCMKVNDSLTCSRWVCTIILYIYHSYHSKFWFLHIDLEYMACIIIFSVRMLLYFPWIYIMQRFLYLSKNKQANSVGNPPRAATYKSL